MQKERKNGRYTREFQQYAVERMKAASNISSLAERSAPSLRFLLKFL